MRAGFAILLFASILQTTGLTANIRRRDKADLTLIEKSAHTMTLMSKGKTRKTYHVALSTQPLGAKERVGDHKVPEGKYIVDEKKATSRFHLALHISYPNAADRARAQKLGADPGGEIEIHGLEKKYAWMGSMHRQMDWADGCIAVTDAEIDEIIRLRLWGPQSKSGHKGDGEKNNHVGTA
jgi:murein L,D-transpeptidase YafK